MGLEYPGGPAIERAAQQGNPAAFKLPRPWLKGTYDFSFSGLKTAMLRIVQKYEGEGANLRMAQVSAPPPGVRHLPVADLAASFQQAIVDVLVDKTRQAAEEYKVKQVLLAGGVASNTLLRHQMAAKLGVPVRYPPPHLCTDNAAMVASAGYFRFKAGKRDGWDLDVEPNLKLV